MSFLKRLFGASQESQPSKKESKEKTVKEKDTSDVKTNGSIKIGEIKKCPYCKKSLSKIPSRKIKCEFCDKYIFVRTRPIDKKKVLVTEKQRDDIEEQWIVYHESQEEDPLSENSEYLKAKEELRKKFGKEPSLNDVKWNLFNKRILEYAIQKQWGLYRNNKFEMASLLKKEGRDKQALGTLFEVCYLDLNGCNNVGTIDGKPPSAEYMKELGIKEFDPKRAFLAPRVISIIEELIQKLNLSDTEAKNIFIQSNEQTKPLKNMPVLIGAAWDKLLDKINKNKKHFRS